MDTNELTVFARRCKTQTTPAGLWHDALDYYAAHGIDKVSYHSDDRAAAGASAPGISAAGFPEEWVCHYIEAKLVLVDPIPSLALQRSEPFLWSEAEQLATLTQAQRDYLHELAASGIGDGLAMQVCGPNLRNAYVGLGFARPCPKIDAVRIFELQCAAQISHLRYCELVTPEHRPAPHLSPRERETLQWMARGKSNSVIADILGLSPHTIDTHTRRLFHKLGVADRTTAAIRALGAGLLSYDDTRKP